MSDNQGNLFTFTTQSNPIIQAMMKMRIIMMTWDYKHMWSYIHTTR